jgi:Spy/CpxP family protein refolding chaperone
MTSTTLLRTALVSAALAGCSLAFAATPASAPAKGGSPQTHHCKQADGSMDMTKTKKACLADKGTWFKDGAAPAASAAAKQ